MSSLDFSWKNEAEVKLNGYILHIFSKNKNVLCSAYTYKNSTWGGSQENYKSVRSKN